MQWLDGAYAGWFNTRHQRVGSLWQGRFGDVVVEDEAWAFDLSLYVHLNPLRVAAGGGRHEAHRGGYGGKTPGQQGGGATFCTGPATGTAATTGSEEWKVEP